MSIFIGPVGLNHFLVLAAVLFTIGAVGVFIRRRNALVILLSIELMLLAANINFIAFAAFARDLAGQVFAMMVLTVAAAEIAVGLAILVITFRNRGSIAVDDISTLKG
jgi:NADH-quinone oxidoreductase subunit K